MVGNEAARAAEAAEQGVVTETSLTPDTPVVPLVLEYADGQESYRLGEYNFYVITRYNHSHLYAMAVAELAEAIKQQAEAEHD